MPLDFLSKLKENFNIKGQKPDAYSALTLAYIGDAFYDLVIRTLVIAEKNRKVNDLHKTTSSIVNAKSQAELVTIIMNSLTEKERDIYHRGRNAKSPTMAKNATVHDYRIATGFEALIGYLYMNNEEDRAIELINKGLKKMGYFT
ncbi:MAG: ribonuclease III [Lachnospiraceae bacterium]|nr:ribonuclease III [Lachnospiraceae bacterium]